MRKVLKVLRKGLNLRILQNKFNLLDKNNPQKPSDAIITTIKELGYQPFILMELREQHSQNIIICRTQNDLAVFLSALSKLPFFAKSVFLQSFYNTLNYEYYDASEGFFNWILQGDGVVHTYVYLKNTLNNILTYQFNSPLFLMVEKEKSDPITEPAIRAELLLQLMRTYDVINGNDAARWRLIEGMALGLVKYFASIEQYSLAQEIVDVGLKYNPKSIHLRAAAFAIDAKLQGKDIPARFQKFIGPDNGALLGKICPEPFKRFDIGPAGDVLVCCGHWLPTSIGNFLTDSIEDILNSEQAKKIRASMLDGSYKYCNHLECAAMIQGYLSDKATVKDPVLREAVDQQKLTVEKVDQVLFAFDQTCNLSCPSCREERIVEKKSLSDKKVEAVEQKLFPILKNLKVLNINPAGEVFASRQSRRVLEMVSKETCPDLKIDIISNGMLFTEQEWEKFPNLNGMIRSVRVSTDAATKLTFEKLRRLGVWEIFIKNMTFLGQLRKANIIPQFKLSFTYQLDNFREMIAFVEFAKSLNCDFVMFERLQNLGAFTWEEFREKAVHLSDHHLHEEFRKIISDPVFKERMVWHDFEWDDAKTTADVSIERKALQESF